jgi:hypothetical protein
MTAIPIPIPTPTSVLTELNTAIATYPDTNVQLEIVEVVLDNGSEVINVNEEAGFRVKITNNGLLNLTDVTLKIKGLNDVLVKTGAAGDFEFEEDLITGPIEKVNGDGGSELMPPVGQSKLKFKAPSKPSDPEQGPQDLIKATLHDWNADLNRMLNAHTDPLSTVKAIFADEVLGD